MILASPPPASLKASGRTGIEPLAIAALIAFGFVEAIAVNLWNPGRKIVALECVYALVTGGVLLWLGRRRLAVCFRICAEEPDRICCDARWHVEAYLASCHCHCDGVGG